MLSTLEQVSDRKGKASKRREALEQRAFLALGTSFTENHFSTDRVGDGLGIIQAHYIYCALYICYYISSTSDHQALDIKFWKLGTLALRERR